MTDFITYDPAKDFWNGTHLVIPVRVSEYEQLVRGRYAHTDPRDGTKCPVLAVSTCDHCGWSSDKESK